MRLSVVLLPLAAANLRADKVDDYIRAEMQKQHIPGLSLAVVKEGKLIKAAGYGLANVELNVPARPDTVYQLQSITKTFTATGIMLLVEEGKVGLEDKITKHLDGLPDTWNAVTVRHLLTHTSGIKDFINEPTVDLRKDVTPDDVIKSLINLPLNFPTGEKYAYSNTGYHLLGMIIHKVTGKYWSDFIRERIFDPLGMTETRVISFSDIVTNRASGYAWVNGRLQNGQFVAPTILAYAGGGIRSTALDMAKWDAALYTEKILKQSSFEQMWTRAKLNNGSRADYGLGWSVEEFRGHPSVSHGGAHMTGFKTTITRFVRDKLTVIVLTNQRAANPANIAVGVAGRYLPGLLLSSFQEKPDPDADRTDKLKTCLSELANKRDSALLTPEFQADYAKTPERATTLAERLRGMKSFKFLDCEDVQGRGVDRLGVAVRSICHYKMVTAKETRYYTFYLTAQDKVAYYQSSEE